MSDLEDLRGRVRQIANELKNAIKVEPDDDTLAGWGQFVEATSPVFQIGPYGTSAGVLTTQIAFPSDSVDPRVKARLRSFWDERPLGKLFPQNVRLAFLVLALAKTPDADLIQLREEIASELRKRQQNDGSWSDAATHPNAPAGGQVDATAWVVLALNRIGASTNAAERGAEWLASRAHSGSTVQLLSPIAVAASIAAHPNPGSVADLRRHGFSILGEGGISREEAISFFDYEQMEENSPVQRRDYLCYPAFFPIAVLINGLRKKATFAENVRLDAYRTDAIKRLMEIIGDRTYKQPTARFASTVDQAIFALSFEHLYEAEHNAAKAASLASPIYKWGKESLVVQLILPLAILATALVTINEPTTVPNALSPLLGAYAGYAATFAGEHKPVIQLATGIFLAIMPALPKSGFRIARDRFLRK